MLLQLSEGQVHHQVQVPLTSHLSVMLRLMPFFRQSSQSGGGPLGRAGIARLLIVLPCLCRGGVSYPCRRSELGVGVFACRLDLEVDAPSLRYAMFGYLNSYRGEQPSNECGSRGRTKIACSSFSFPYGRKRCRP